MALGCRREANNDDEDEEHRMRLFAPPNVIGEAEVVTVPNLPIA
jgi:hypothetical protein